MAGRSSVRGAWVTGIHEVGDEDPQQSHRPHPADAQYPAPEHPPFTLENCSTELTPEYLADKPPAVGREAVIDVLVNTLLNPTHKSAVLVGDPGVGKTAILEGLARLIHAGKVPDSLKKARLFLIQSSSLLSGKGYPGEFEKKIDDLKRNIVIHSQDSRVCILMIDELHSLVGAGTTRHTHNTFFDMLKAELAAGKIIIMGATTTHEYKLFEEDTGAQRRFSPIYVEEPDLRETFEILRGVKTYLEHTNQVTILDEALQAAVLLCHHKKGRRPDTAVTLLEAAIAQSSLDKQFSPEMVSLTRRIGKLKEKKNLQDGSIIGNLRPTIEKIADLERLLDLEAVRFEKEKVLGREIEHYRKLRALLGKRRDEISVDQIEDQGKIAVDMVKCNLERDKIQAESQAKRLPGVIGARQIAEVLAKENVAQTADEFLAEYAVHQAKANQDVAASEKGEIRKGSGRIANLSDAVLSKLADVTVALSGLEQAMEQPAWKHDRTAYFARRRKWALDQAGRSLFMGAGLLAMTALPRWLSEWLSPTPALPLPPCMDTAEELDFAEAESGALGVNFILTNLAKSLVTGALAEGLYWTWNAGKERQGVLAAVQAIREAVADYHVEQDAAQLLTDMIPHMKRLIELGVVSADVLPVEWLDERPISTEAASSEDPVMSPETLAAETAQSAFSAVYQSVWKCLNHHGDKMADSEKISVETLDRTYGDLDRKKCIAKKADAWASIAQIMHVLEQIEHKKPRDLPNQVLLFKFQFLLAFYLIKVEEHAIADELNQLFLPTVSKNPLMKEIADGDRVTFQIVGRILRLEKIGKQLCRLQGTPLHQFMVASEYMPRFKKVMFDDLHADEFRTDRLPLLQMLERKLEERLSTFSSRRFCEPEIRDARLLLRSVLTLQVHILLHESECLLNGHPELSAAYCEQMPSKFKRIEEMTRLMTEAEALAARVAAADAATTTPAATATTRRTATVTRPAARAGAVSAAPAAAVSRPQVAVVEEDFLAQGICDLITNLQKKNQAFKKAREDHDQLVDGSGAPAVIPTPPSHVAAPFAAAAANGAPAAAEPEAVAPPRRASMPLRAVAAVANTPGAMISNLD